MLLVRTVISVLCAVGFYASVFMLSKSVRAARGMLAEPSVVQTERASLFFGTPNSLIGLVYYTALAAVSWWAHHTFLLALALAAAAFAAATSLYLAYSLLFVTRRSCPYCWAAHAVNWALLAAVPWLLVLHART
ncbi:MAG TPA: vitamin K epoxide reductase family protein [Candidatus Baltobacteraceae bacterium]|nr:vitamin K epoxide reductase family protein [Candidatus Baltobacteraceae bacterium]